MLSTSRKAWSGWEVDDIYRAQPQPAEVEIRNEARAHFWYEQKFDMHCPPHESTEAAIDLFAATTCCLGVRLEPG